MLGRKRKLYATLLAISAISGAWLLFQQIQQSTKGSLAFGVCLFKQVTGQPCPACGTTRAVMSLSSGNFWESLCINPLGIVAVLLLSIVPLWIVADLIRKSDSFYRFYLQAENLLKRRYVAIPLIIIILVNWIWNITKQL